MANLQKATGHGHFLEMKNSVYHCRYDLASNKVNVIRYSLQDKEIR